MVAVIGMHGALSAAWPVAPDHGAPGSGHGVHAEACDPGCRCEANMRPDVRGMISRDKTWMDGREGAAMRDDLIWQGMRWLQARRNFCRTASFMSRYDKFWGQLPLCVSIRHAQRRAGEGIRTRGGTREAQCPQRLGLEPETRWQRFVANGFAKFCWCSRLGLMLWEVASNDHDRRTRLAPLKCADVLLPAFSVRFVATYWCTINISERPLRALPLSADRDPVPAWRYRADTRRAVWAPMAALVVAAAEAGRWCGRRRGLYPGGAARRAWSRLRPRL